MSTQENGRTPSYTADPKEVLRFQQERIIKLLFTSFLVVLEDVGLEHDEALTKLVAALPPEYRQYVDLADYLTPEKGQRLRKKVLDAGNNALRQLDEVVQSLDIHFKS